MFRVLSLIVAWKISIWQLRFLLLFPNRPFMFCESLSWLLGTFILQVLLMLLVITNSWRGGFFGVECKFSIFKWRNNNVVLSFLPSYRVLRTIPIFHEVVFINRILSWLDCDHFGRRVWQFFFITFNPFFALKVLHIFKLLLS